MSHSTHSGFSAPLSSSGETVRRNFSLAPWPPHLHNAAPPVLFIAVGVGYIFTADTREGEALALSDGQSLLSASDAFGVGNIAPIKLSRPRSEGGKVLFFASFAVGVGNLLYLAIPTSV